jgi:type IV fimbrial biogenesis protein FimT
MCIRSDRLYVPSARWSDRRPDVMQYHFARLGAPVNCRLMKRQNGFTLTEMLIVSAIVAILLGIAIPSYKYISTSYRMSAEVNGLLGDLQFARGEALKEGNGVTACVSTDGLNCTGGGNWNPGWIVFSDPNSNAKVDAGERVLRVQSAFTGVIPDAFNASNAVTAVTFNREGFATTAAGFVTTTLTLTESTNNNAYTRCLQLSAVGMLSSQTRAMSPATC